MVVVRFMRHNGLFGTWTGKGGGLVLVTVFRQHNLQFWLMLALFYMSIFWHVAYNVDKGTRGLELRASNSLMQYKALDLFHNRKKFVSCIIIPVAVKYCFPSVKKTCDDSFSSR